MKPITPDEVAKGLKPIPDGVIAAFNALIVRRWDGYMAVVAQEDVLERLAVGDRARQQILDAHWLDIEGHYSEAGWDVEYDKPGYNETYDPKFIFRKAKR
jgi:hypothetical protein